MRERVRLTEALASVEQFGGELADAAEAAIQRANEQEDSFEERVEEGIRSRTASLDAICSKQAQLQAREGDLETKERAVDKLEARFGKTSEKIREEITPKVRTEEQKRADDAIDEARRLANELVAQANAASEQAILKAESTRVEQLTLLLNRFAHELVALDPSKVELYDYLVLTNQQKGRSGRKDCTDTDLRKIRQAWESRL